MIIEYGFCFELFCFPGWIWNHVWLYSLCSSNFSPVQVLVPISFLVCTGKCFWFTWPCLFVNVLLNSSCLPHNLFLFLKRHESAVRFLYFHFYDNKDNTISDNFLLSVNITTLTTFFLLMYLSLYAQFFQEKKKIILLSYFLHVFYCHG